MPEAPFDHVFVITPREVPLGGPRAMTVRRTLPARETSLVGAWCFADHVGPDDVSATGGMRVARHPHTGLATVSWLFDGSITHRDAIGSHALVEPATVDLMVAGYGITHSEFSTLDATVMSGLQLWYALPDAVPHRDREFATHAPAPLAGRGVTLRVGLGSLCARDEEGAVLEDASPLVTDIPLHLAQIDLAPGAAVELELDGAHEYGLIADRGALAIEVPGDDAAEGAGGAAETADLGRGHLAITPDGTRRIRVRCGADGDPPEPGRAVLIGGEPLGEDIVMWWNLVGRTHDEIAAFRARYQAEVGAEGEVADAPIEEGTRAAGLAVDAEQFGPWPPGTPQAWSAPPLPNARLKPRGRRGLVRP